MGKEAAARRLAREGGTELDTVDHARASEYKLIARLIAGPPHEKMLAGLVGLAGGESPIGQAHASLAAAARETSAAQASREHFRLFVGVGRGEFLPYASYYLTGFLNERPLAEVRRDLTRLGVARADGVHDPEDHIAILFDVMAGLASGTFDAPAGADRDFFDRHLSPWAGRFFEDLAMVQGARFYRAVGALGAAFLAVETEAFALDEIRSAHV